MKYKLINNQTKEEYLCDKVTIDEFDYYVSTEIRVNRNDFYYDFHGNIHQWTHDFQTKNKLPNSIADTYPKVIATNNPNVNIAKVVDEFECSESKLRQEALQVLKGYSRAVLSNSYSLSPLDGYKKGYNKSQETHSFSEDDMIEFQKFVKKYFVIKKGKYRFKGDFYNQDKRILGEKELFHIWKEQQPKTVYYE